ncbi:hypothetical protein KIN20_020178 [Parelaphostrongylus tenuis]|uniref:Uncharacterized protein n=1 Tax=Parelaphostrongylus tenuis TaxID=148309 RepID=A0AAD5N2Z5_PARTN|nr:hypothetical protein KIN20_020178 [Parelaphostrongylus tenuis]
MDELCQDNVIVYKRSLLVFYIGSVEFLPNKTIECKHRSGLYLTRVLSISSPWLKMVFLVNKAGIPTDYFMISLLATISTVFGCGVMPAGQGSTRNFTVTGFTLPVAMAYSTSTAVLAQVPGIATSEAGAKGFVERLVMQTPLSVDAIFTVMRKLASRHY